MDPKIRLILDDLYRIEPDLQAQEDELIPLVKRLLTAKPDTHFDATFAKKLRIKLMQKTSQRDVSIAKNHMPSTSPVFFQRLAYATIGGLLTLVVAVPLTYQISQPGAGLKQFGLGSTPPAPTFNDLGTGAFGLLSMQADGLGGDAARSAQAGAMSGGGGVASAEADKMMIAPGEPYPGPMYTYRYNYNGETLDLSTVSDTVYRRSGGINLAGRGADLSNMQVGPVNLGAFSDLEIQNFSVKQADKNGYSVYVDPLNGSISISGNEGVWGYDTYVQITEGDVLPDAELIDMASRFVSKYGIDTSSFGDPVVDNRGLLYALTQPEGQRYIPDVLNVTYPMLVDGQPVFSNDGSAYGMMVMINMRTKAVANVNVNVGSAFDRSAYELERDAGTILSYAAKGGIYNYGQQEGGEMINIELGTPEVILMTHYNYTNGVSETLFVPALSFPILTNSDKYPVYQTSITIPLVKDIIAQAQQIPEYHILDAQLREEEAVKQDEMTIQIVE